EHFELVKEHKKVQLEAQRYFDELCEGGWHDKEYHEFKNPQPYKFEDLKPNMYIWDDKERGFYKITKILSKEECKHLYHDENKKVFMTFLANEFEENRFFPVTKALQYQK
ncbi:MAG: hypothetical protein U0N20_01890, partial [Clostridium sp.]